MKKDYDRSTLKLTTLSRTHSHHSHLCVTVQTNKLKPSLLPPQLPNQVLGTSSWHLSPEKFCEIVHLHDRSPIRGKLQPIVGCYVILILHLAYFASLQMRCNLAIFALLESLADVVLQMGPGCVS